MRPPNLVLARKDLFHFVRRQLMPRDVENVVVIQSNPELT